jgi:hypothetical protein
MEAEQFDPEAIAAQIESYRQTLDLENGDYASLEGIKTLFDYYNLLVEATLVADAFDAITGIRLHLDAALEADPENLELLEYLIEWNQQAMRFSAFVPDEYSEYPFLEEIVAVAEPVPALHGRMWQARVSMLVNWDNWQRLGGKVDQMDQDVRAILEELKETLLADMEAAIEDLKSAEHHAQVVHVRRAISLYTRLQNDPNASISALKALLEDLQQLPDYTPAMRAETLVEIARLLMEYKKFKPAIPYLTEAVEILTEAVEADETLEMRLYQAEALLEECQAA